jgi:aminoglycoside 2'-N-acetyltransferase I
MPGPVVLPHDVRLDVAHTAHLEAHLLARARALMDLAFPGDFEDDDWDHGLGGLHVLAVVGDEVVGHGSVVARSMATAGRAWRVGYVECMAVHPDRQRRGIGTALMVRLEEIVRGAYDFGALGASDEGMGLYLRRGWQVWRGPLRAMTPEGVVDTPEEAGAVLVLPGVVALDLDGTLVCEHREGDVW